MNCVVCQHPGNSGYFLFQAPEGVEIDTNTLVMCETSRGKQLAVTVTGTFRADDSVKRHWGGENSRIKRVISIMREFMLEWNDGETEEKVSGDVKYESKSISDEDDSD